jgi:hypothetical protein
MKNLYFERSVDKIFNDIFSGKDNRVQKVQSLIDKERVLFDFSNMYAKVKNCEEALKNFNLSSDPLFSESLLNYFEKQKISYQEYREDAANLGADVSGLPEKLNYLEAQN